MTTQAETPPCPDTDTDPFPEAMEGGNDVLDAVAKHFRVLREDLNAKIEALPRPDDNTATDLLIERAPQHGSKVRFTLVNDQGDAVGEAIADTSVLAALHESQEIGIRMPVQPPITRIQIDTKDLGEAIHKAYQEATQRAHSDES